MAIALATGLCICIAPRWARRSAAESAVVIWSWCTGLLSHCLLRPHTCGLTQKQACPCNGVTAMLWCVCFSEAAAWTSGHEELLLMAASGQMCACPC